MNAHRLSPYEARRPLKAFLFRLALIGMLAQSLVGAGSTRASDLAAQFYVAETGHVLADPFLRYWVDHDGERLLGFPVTDVVKLGGRSAQYFQFGVLVHKSNGEPSRLKSGATLLALVRSDPAIVAGRRAPSAPTHLGLASPTPVHQSNMTGEQLVISVDPLLLPYWRQWNGAESLGRPLSAAYRQGDTRTQWFEFGRIDFKGGTAVRAEIGLELARTHGVPTEGVGRAGRALFDPARFVTFTGDGTIPNAERPFDPVRLIIPRIQVDAAIEITTVENGVMANPVDPWKAGWYQSFARPGEWTNTVVAGHRDWWGYGPVVFWDLGWLQPGDKIYLRGADGTGATYVVEVVEVVPRTIDPQAIISDVGYEALTLITCGGVWTGTEYTDRIIVRAYRI